MTEKEALVLFDRWFEQAVRKLDELPNGDGGFAAFMVGLALYERLIVAEQKLAKRDSSPEAVNAAMAADLGLTGREQAIFWSVFRAGLLHQGMPQAGNTSWLFRHTFAATPTFGEYDGQPVVCIDPWKFTRRVLRRFHESPSKIIASESFPLGSVFPLDESKLKLKK